MEPETGTKTGTILGLANGSAYFIQVESEPEPNNPGTTRANHLRSAPRNGPDSSRVFNAPRPTRNESRRCASTCGPTVGPSPASLRGGDGARRGRLHAEGFSLG